VTERPGEWLPLATQAARIVGDDLARNRADGARVTAQRHHDVKLRADVAAEDRIVYVLRGGSPFAILSEERGRIEGAGDASGLRWIVDPLDGSLNYLQGIPFCCVSIGLWDAERPLLGVVYDFDRGELYTGVVGDGAWRDGTPIRAASTNTCDRAVLCTGFPAATDFSPEALTDFVDRVRAYRKVRLLGSAALSLAYVASGRADAYVERDIKVWDVAAGLAIVRAAGGLATWKVTTNAETLAVYAGAPDLPALEPA
jgi:fructose-1,6-bisphosphatase/inositol monophosphatase family enzyme